MNTVHGRTVFLSRSERRIGGRRFQHFSALNGLGISFLGETPVYLMAVYFGATNLELGLISAMLHISGIILLMIPRIFKGKNVVTIGFWSWFIRGLTGLLYTGLLFLEGRAAVALILTAYTLFCLARTTGLSMVTTVQKRLTISRTQGDVVSRNSASFQGTAMLSRFISFLILSLKNLAELIALFLLPLLGLVANTTAAFMFHSIPNRTKVEWRPKENLFRILAGAMALPESRRVLASRWITLGQTVLAGMAVPFLRRSAGIGADKIFLFTMAAGMGAWLASVMLRPVMDRAGSRPLLFWSAIPELMILTAWAFVPEHWSWEAYTFLNFFTWFFLVTGYLTAHRLLIRITPENGAVGFNAMETFVTSIFALALGFIAGFLVDLSSILQVKTPINDFGLVFLLSALGSLGLIYFAWRMKDKGSLGLVETIRTLSHWGNLKTWKAVTALETSGNPVKRQTVLSSLSHSRAPAATGEIRRILAEPLSKEKGEILEALFTTRRPELAEDLRKEAANPWSYHRERAIFALGAYEGAETEQLLIELLDDPSPEPRSAAAKSLARLGVMGVKDRVLQMASKATTLRERLDYLIALYHFDPNGRFFSDTISPETAAKGEELERPMHTLIARLTGMSPPLSALYREETRRMGQGMEILLEETRETTFLLEREDLIRKAWKEGQYESLWELCRTALDTVSVSSILDPLRSALLSFPPNAASRTNTMAVLYYTYHILTARGES